MGTSILSNGLMTVVSAASPTVNYDYQTQSAIRKPAGGGSAGEVSWLLYFSRPFPLGATITGARLYLYSGATAQTGSIGITAQRLKTSVVFSKVTWNTRPTTYYAGTAADTETGPVVAGKEWLIDVTAMMQSVALGDAWYGFRLSSTTLNPALLLYGPTWSDSTLRPRLEIDWSDTPDQPTTLAPAGNRAVSVAKPVLRCDYVDVSGAVTMASIQVQVNATDVWTSPGFDSGTVASSVPELDLATTAYAGLTDGTSAWWRVRVQDAAGLWSAWSIGTQFARDSKGTLALTNPGISPNNFVTESTPPISWTFTGETQAAYQITITGVTAAGLVTSWTTGKITSTVQTLTLPTGVLTTPDAVYTMTVRIWDAKQRESTPGDPAYAELVRDFTFALSADTATVTALTSTWLDPYPKIQLNWTRTTDPDSFTIMRNRLVIASGLLPGDVRVSGTAFAWIDFSPSPQTVNTYEVLAVVNGKASISNPTTVQTFRSQGIFLADLSRVNDVAIMGRADRNFTYGESSEVLEVVGATEVILITQGLRGIEGQVTGQLQTGVLGLSTTAQQWRDKLLAIKKNPGRRLWLTVGDRTIQIVARRISVSPRPVATLSFDVAFDFHQVGTLEFVPSL